MKFVFTLLFAVGLSSHADELLKVGSSAPELKIERWMRGEPVMQFEKGKVYVVEFWATWCGPCVRMMPHLIDFQNKYADQGLKVIGVASREDTPDRNVAEDTIEKFLVEKFPEINYAIAFEHGGIMNKTWLEPGLARGIPHAFVVDREGKIAFIGHPAFLEEVLPKVLDGTLDLQESQSKDEERIKRDQPLIENRKILKPIMEGRAEARKLENWPRALQLTEAALAITPEDPQLVYDKAELLLHKLREINRGFVVLSEQVKNSIRSEKFEFLAMGVKLLFERGQDYSHLPEKLRFAHAKEMSERFLAELPKMNYGFLLVHPIAEYLFQSGELERGEKVLRQSIAEFEKLEDENFKKSIGPKYMEPMARHLADLTGEGVCIGDMCVLPTGHPCESEVAGGDKK